MRDANTILRKAEPPVMDDISHLVAKVRHRQSKRLWLSSEEKLFIIWGVWKGYALSRICTAMGNVTYKAVHNWSDAVRRSPEIAFELEVIEIVGDKKYRCKLCGGVRFSIEKVMRHFMGHIVPYEIAAEIPIKPIRIL